MFDIFNSSGFDLYRPFTEIDQWVVDTKNGSPVHGTLKECVIFMTKKLGFQMKDIENGLSLFMDNFDSKHNLIHFGALRTPIFTKYKEVNYERSA